MKKKLSLILAVMMLLGCMSVTAFAEDNTTDITAVVPDKTLSYDMVIPASTTLTEEAHENVLLGTDGKVSIANVVNGADKDNVSYTVDLTNGNLTDGTNTIDATYKFKQGEGEFAAIDNTTKVTVYANKTITDSFVNVTADDTQWDAAPAGTYNASVTFNFSSEEVESEHFNTLSDILATVSTIPSGDELAWKNGRNDAYLKIADNKLKAVFNRSAITMDLNSNITKTAENVYTCTAQYSGTWTLTLDNGILKSVNIAGSDMSAWWDGTYEYRPA